MVELLHEYMDHMEKYWPDTVRPLGKEAYSESANEFYQKMN